MVYFHSTAVTFGRETSYLLMEEVRNPSFSDAVGQRWSVLMCLTNQRVNGKEVFVAYALGINRTFSYYENSLAVS